MIRIIFCNIFIYLVNHIINILQLVLNLNSLNINDTKKFKYYINYLYKDGIHLPILSVSLKTFLSIIRCIIYYSIEEERKN